MDELSIYFTPLAESPEETPDRLSARIEAHTAENGFPELGTGTDIVLIGVEEFRRTEAADPEKDGLKAVREHFYELADHFPNLGIADLGNIAPGHDPSDTDHALANSVASAIYNELLPIVIGGGHELSYAHFRGYQDLERTINIAVADALVDLGDPEAPLDDRSFLGHLLSHRPNFLFDLVHLASQRHYIPPELMEVLERMNFDIFRLGEMQGRVQEMEPLVRDVDLFSFDLSALKGSESPASSIAGPNGLYGEEACQMMRYAGMSDKLSSLGLYGYLSHLDRNGLSAGMVAQMLWYFIDGYASRTRDYPILNRKELKKFTVDLQESGHRLIFYKSRKSDRWWMEVPYPPDPAVEHERTRLTPCSYSDYLTALENEIPDKWWRTYRKLA
jgi:formiminoglutamase